MTANLSHAELAELNDYDALQLGLPRHVEAVLQLRVEGRPESERFTVSYTFRPAAHARPWSHSHVEGFMLQVGGKSYRLNVLQWQAIQLVAAFATANTLGERLALWPELMRLTHSPRSAKLELVGYVPHLSLQEAQAATIYVVDGMIIPVPLLSMQRPMTHGFVKHDGKLVSWETCYREGFISDTAQTKRRSYIRLSRELVDALTLLHQSTVETVVKNPTKAFAMALDALPASHRHLLLQV